jgi:Dolichyl-phosphate-mannose-protein mannosyltransferase
VNPVFRLLECLVIFFGVVFGLGLPLVAPLRLTPSEKIGVGAAAGMVVLYLFALLRYWLHLPVPVCLLAPLLAAAAVAVRWRACRPLLQDPAARRMLGAYVLVAAWCLGFLALVRSYSGGGWALDWADHYDRARLFLELWPARTILYGGDHLTTRPPLANAVTSVFLGLTGTDFGFFQIFTSLANSLVFLPLWLLAGRFGRSATRAQAVLTVLFMLSPSVLENCTFAWTKLITAFFVLTSLYLYLPALATGSWRRFAAAFVFLSAGFLAHYSAGPYAVALVVAYFVWQRPRWRQPVFWANTVRCALPAALLLATWFAWAIGVFGVRGTFLNNTSVTESTAHSFRSFVHEKSVNLIHTLIPHPLRPVNHELIEQASRLGYVRDYFFQLYQVSLPVMFGTVGGLTLMWLLWRSWRETRRHPAAPPRAFWLWFAVCTIVLGTAAYGGIDAWGVAHLCLQSLVGLGLAFLAARLDSLPRWWRLCLAAGVTVDFVLGGVLQFYLENRYFSPAEVLRSHDFFLLHEYGPSMWVNLWAKVLHGDRFVGDWPIPRFLLLALLACLFALALLRLWQEHPLAAPAGPDVRD